MSFADTPAPHGATKINFRQTTPYVYLAYPSTRYHSDGRSVEVKNAEEDAALGEPWRDTPYPQPLPVALPPEPTFEELKVKAAQLVQENEELKRENTDMKAYIAEQMNQSSVDKSRKSNKKTEAA